MVTTFKNILYRHFFAIAPRRIQELYFQTKVLIPHKILTQKYSEAIEFLKKSGPLGDYLEFGVFRGDSLVCMYKALERHKIHTIRLFGFDSFEGLPEITDKNDRLLPWQKGEFVSSLETTKRNIDKAQVDWKRIFLVKGFFNKTLNRKFLEMHKLKKASIIMVDCDLYTSAKEALDFCAPLIKDQAIIFFDDWVTDSNNIEKEMGEKLAFKQMLKSHTTLLAEEFGSYSHIEQKHSYTAKIFLVTRKKRK